jgi:hypothetical protein
MMFNNFFFLFSSVIFSLAVLSNGKPLNLMAIACARNPNLSMCATSTDDSETFHAFDAPESSETHAMRSFPKTEFEDLQVEKYCNRHQEHYSHYCAGESSSIERQLQSKVLKFCPSFEKFCPELATRLNSATIKRSLDDEMMFRDSGVPLVEPPPLPSASQIGGLSFDSPIEDRVRVNQIPARRPESALSPDLIKTCTPDCTAPHCTRECKCANTHPSVHAKCNPPENAALVGVCQAWYNKCPMFKPVSY